MFEFEKGEKPLRKCETGADQLRATACVKRRLIQEILSIAKCSLKFTCQLFQNKTGFFEKKKATSILDSSSVAYLNWDSLYLALLKQAFLNIRVFPHQTNAEFYIQVSYLLVLLDSKNAEISLPAFMQTSFFLIRVQPQWREIIMPFSKVGWIVFPRPRFLAYVM